MDKSDMTTDRELKPCPFCGDEMENRGYGAIHVGNEKCILGDLALDPDRWNTRPTEDALRSEVETPRKDAERYRYLRERPVDTIEKGGVFAGKVPENLIINLEDLDHHVDAAIAALGGGER